MASGKAVVTSDIPPLRELLEPEVSGLVFPLGDVPALKSDGKRARSAQNSRLEDAGARARVRERIALALLPESPPFRRPASARPQRLAQRKQAVAFESSTDG